VQQPGDDVSTVMPIASTAVVLPVNGRVGAQSNSVAEESLDDAFAYLELLHREQIIGAETHVLRRGEISAEIARTGHYDGRTNLNMPAGSPGAAVPGASGGCRGKPLSSGTAGITNRRRRSSRPALIIFGSPPTTAASVR
jgi:hypothetical protein